jgi:hypothetical protein
MSARTDVNGFMRGFQAWVRFGERPRAHGANRDGYDYAAALNERSGQRPTCADAKEWAHKYAEGRFIERIWIAKEAL